MLRPALFGYIVTREEFEQYATELYNKFVLEDGMDVKIHKIYDLKDIAQAHEDIEGRKTSGKLLLRI